MPIEEEEEYIYYLLSPTCFCLLEHTVGYYIILYVDPKIVLRV